MDQEQKTKQDAEQNKEQESCCCQSRGGSRLKVIFKAVIWICVIIFTVANAYYYFWFLPEQRDYNRAESKRYECKQDVQSLIAQYNSVASSLDQTKQADQQSLYNFARNLGIVDDQGNPLDNKTLIQKCIEGKL